jgi:hypothetical protein
LRNVCSEAAQLGRQLLRRPHPGSQHPHRLKSELRRVRRSRPRHLPLLSRAAWPESITVSTEAGQFQAHADMTATLVPARRAGLGRSSSRPGAVRAGRLVRSL